MRARVKWNSVGNKCSAEFFNLVKQRHNSSVITELQDNHGRIFTKKEDLDSICHAYYKQLYKHKPIREEAMREVFVDFTPTFSEAMNEALAQEITESELGW